MKKIRMKRIESTADWTSNRWTSNRFPSKLFGDYDKQYNNSAVTSIDGSLKKALSRWGKGFSRDWGNRNIGAFFSTREHEETGFFQYIHDRWVDISFT